MGRDCPPRGRGRLGAVAISSWARRRKFAAAMRGLQNPSIRGDAQERQQKSSQNKGKPQPELEFGNDFRDFLFAVGLESRVDRDLLKAARGVGKEGGD